MIKNKYLGFIVYLLLFFAVWYGVEYFYASYFKHETFRLVLGNLDLPIVTGLITGYFFYYKKKQ